MPEFIVRRAEPSEAATIARIHIASWKATYGAIYPPHIIAERTRWDVRYPLWVDRLTTDRSVFVVGDADGVFGFACACAMPERPEDREPLPHDAYLQSLYLAPGRQRSGAGRALLDAIARDRREHGERSMALHVVKENPSRGFYERLGAQHVRDEPQAPGDTWTTCAYAFADLGALVVPT